MNCRPIYNRLVVHKTLTDIVINVYLIYVSLAGLGLGTAGLDYKTADDADITQSQEVNHHRIASSDTGACRMQDVNSLRRDSRALRGEYCIVFITRNTAI